MFFGALPPVASSPSSDDAQRRALISKITDDVVRGAAINAIVSISQDPTKNDAATQTDATNAAQAAAQAARDLQASVEAHARTMHSLAAQRVVLRRQLASLGGRP